MNTAKVYQDSEGCDCSIMQMVKREQYWAANRIQEGEKAIEENEQLRAQLATTEAKLKESEAALALCLDALGKISLAGSMFQVSPEMTGEQYEQQFDWIVDLADRAYESIPSTAKQDAEILKAAERLIEWDKKYPKGTMYNATIFNQCEGELSDIIEEIKAVRAKDSTS